MPKVTSKRPPRGAGQHEPEDAQRSRGPAGSLARRKATNLTLDPAAVARGEGYRLLHGMGSLSQLVNALLGALPSSEVGAPARRDLAPAVRRLLGVARPPMVAGDAAARTADDARAAYRAHLVDKYGGAA